MKKLNISYLIFLALTLPVWLSAASFNGAAEWITHPNIDVQSYAVILLKNDFQLPKIPDSLYVHVSADNHYRLYVNGQYVVRGPARGDVSNWYYDSVDIAPFLNEGRNVIAAEVTNWGPHRSPAYISKGTAFYLKSESAEGEVLNTGIGDWICYHNKAHHPVVVDWVNDRSTIDFGYYAGNPTDSIEGDLYPWGWETLDFDDSQWVQAVAEDNAAVSGNENSSERKLLKERILVSRHTPLIKEEAVPFGKIRSAIGLAEGHSYIDKMGALVIPPNEHVILLIDYETITIGYPEIIVSGGKNSRVRAMYAENLITDHKKPRGNRNVINGKYMVGIKDIFMPDGADHRRFRPTSLRTFRYIQLDIETSDQPLIMENYYHVASKNQLKLKAAFHTGDSIVNWMMDAGWRTVSLCAHDILFADAYYEQLQNATEARIHNLTLLHLSGDDSYLRNTLIQFDQSRTSEGLTRVSYPHSDSPVLPSHSLAWVNMVYDYMLWKDDKHFIASFQSGITDVLNWYRQRIKLLGWPVNFSYSENEGIDSLDIGSHTIEKSSTWNTLYYAYTLRNAADVSSYLGKRLQAWKYRREARRINRMINRSNSNEEGFYTNNTDDNSIDVHSQIMAVLSGAAGGKDAVRLLDWVLDERKAQLNDLSMYFYLFEAMKITGLQYKFYAELGPWELMKQNGLTTFTDLSPTKEEQNQKAECSPASSAPNYFFFRAICGIKPLGAGHHEVEIAPAPQLFNTLQSSYPHHLGDLKMDLEFKESAVTGEIIVPEGMNAYFIWKNKKHRLHSGAQSVSF